MAEKVTDFGMGKEELLRLFGPSQASLLPLVVSGRAVTLLDQVVLPFGRRDSDVLSRVKLR